MSRHWFFTSLAVALILLGGVGYLVWSRYGESNRLNVIVLTGLCLAVVQIPNDTVYGRILPALGIALPLGNIWYAVLARRLARRENRGDVTALPYGPSVPHTFIVVFVVMLPVAIGSGDALTAGVPKSPCRSSCAPER